MHKEYTTTITINHSTIREVIDRLMEIQLEMLARSNGSHFEENEVGLGWETEVRTAHMDAGEILDWQAKNGVGIDPNWLK